MFHGSLITELKLSFRSEQIKAREQKYLHLLGKISKGGLIEVPMGITIRQIVERIGDGVADGRDI